MFERIIKLIEENADIDTICKPAIGSRVVTNKNYPTNTLFQWKNYKYVYRLNLGKLELINIGSNCRFADFDETKIAVRRAGYIFFREGSVIEKYNLVVHDYEDLK